jgi:hypothetical protein
MTYNDLITKVKEIITTGVSEIQTSYDYSPAEISAFPCLVVIPIGHEDSFLTLSPAGSNVRQYTLTIRIIGNMEDTEVNTQKTIRAITDKVINVLEKNPTLDGTIDWCYPTKARFAFEGQPAKYYFADITLTVKFRFSRT